MVKKKVVLFCLLLVVLTIFSTGCTNVLSNVMNLNKDKVINLTLSGFPYQFTSYDLKIYVEEKGEKGVTNIYEYNNISSNQTIKESLKVDKDANFIMIYLFSHDEHMFDDPEYFRRIELDSRNKDYNALYWIDYDRYRWSTEYGISEQMAQTIEAPFSDEIDFNTQPYYIYKLSDVQNLDIQIDVKSTAGKVFLGYSSTVGNDLQNNKFYSNDETNYELYMCNWQNEDLYVLIKPKESVENSKVTVSIKTMESTYVNEEIIKMVPGDTPNIVYALDNRNNLYYLNPLTKSIENKFNLGTGTFISMAYYSDQEKLYILNQKLEVVVWDTVNNTIAKRIPFLATNSYANTRDIKVAPTLGYIYVSSSYGITILDIDTEQEIASFNVGSFGSIAIDEAKGVLFALNLNSERLYKYSIGVDPTITELKNTPASTYGGMELSSDGSKVVLCEYSSPKYILKVYDTDLMDIQLGEWGIENVTDFTLSPDGSLLYVSTRDYALYVVDMENYTQIRKLTFGSRSNTEVITNSDGSVLIAVGTNSYYESGYRIYYFEDIKK